MTLYCLCYGYHPILHCPYYISLTASQGSFIAIVLNMYILVQEVEWTHEFHFVSVVGKGAPRITCIFAGLSYLIWHNYNYTYDMGTNISVLYSNWDRWDLVEYKYYFDKIKSPKTQGRVRIVVTIVRWINFAKCLNKKKLYWFFISCGLVRVWIYSQKYWTNSNKREFLSSLHTTYIDHKVPAIS